MSINEHLKSISREAYLQEYERNAINTSIHALKRNLGYYFDDNIIKSFIFGSYSRDTILPRSKDSYSDIDYMVVLKDKSTAPQAYLNRLKRFVEKYYKTSEIHQSNPTIVLELNHIRFELVPAIEDTSSYHAYQPDNYMIPAKASAYEKWINTNPKGFNSKLVEKNKANNSLIKPLIRIMKYWNALNSYPFESYYLEQLIVNEYYQGLHLKDYFYHFVLSLQTSYNYTNLTNSKIIKLKEAVEKIKNEEKSYPYTSEVSLKKILP